MKRSTAANHELDANRSDEQPSSPARWREEDRLAFRLNGLTTPGEPALRAGVYLIRLRAGDATRTLRVIGLN